MLKDEKLKALKNPFDWNKSLGVHAFNFKFEEINRYQILMIKFYDISNILVDRIISFFLSFLIFLNLSNLQRVDESFIVL